MHSAYNSHKTLFFSDDVKTITLQNAVFKLNGMREKEKKNVILLNRFVSKWMPQYGESNLCQVADAGFVARYEILE